MVVSAQTVKDLRDKTGAGMMDCKKALAEAGGDIDKAVEVLRKSGIAKAEKKSGRATKEGMVVAEVGNGVGALLEVLCETDFVTKNEMFRQYSRDAVKRLFRRGGDGCLSEAFGKEEEAEITKLIATIGENMQVRRAVRWDTGAQVAAYLHMGGRIGVMVEAEGAKDETLLSDICMHIAAFNPRFIGPSEVPAELLDKEKEIAAAQVVGKPTNIVEKIVSGKLEKWYSEVCLTRQPWLRDDKTCLAKLCPGLKIKRFVRWEMGEALD